MNKFLLPLGIFAVLVVLLGVGLTRDPKTVPSPYVGKTPPSFVVPRLYQPEKTIGSEDMKGKVWLLNVFASWCVSCRSEHPLLVDLAKTGEVEIIGLNYKDERADAMGWLEQLGNPYDVIAFDLKGDVGIDWGVYGVPETFVVDKHGVVRYKQIGPVTEQALRETIMPLVRQLKAES